MDKPNDDTIWVKRRKVVQSYSMSSSHYHNYHEIFYLAEGECSLFMHHTIYKMHAGDLAIIPAGTIHKTTYLSNCDHERIVVDYKDEHIKELKLRYGDKFINQFLGKNVISFTNKQKFYLEELMDKIILEITQPDDLSDGFINVLLTEFLLLLIRNQKKDTEIYKTMNLENESMQHAANFIFYNYDKPITLTSVAEMLHLNRSYFSKRFKQTTGFGFKEYLIHIRIKHAELLLLESTKSITEIALACGFTDSNYFGDSFRHVNGISPLAFRKRKLPF